MISQPVLTLRGFYDGYYEPLKLRSRSHNTKRLYHTTLVMFERFLQRTPTLADLNEDTVNRFLSARRDEGLSPYSVNKERFNLLAIWRWAYHRRGPDGNQYVDTWPEIEMEPAPKNEPVAWMASEIAHLFRYLKRMKGNVGDAPASVWWTALHYVLWDTGERVSAVLGVTWSDLDLQNGWLNVPAINRKGGRVGRMYRLHPESIPWVRRLLPFAVDDKVFVWPGEKNLIWYHYGKILKRAGLPHDSKSKFHRMRKSVASHFKAAGGNATELLGHSRNSVTDAYYDPRITRPTQAIDLLFRPDADPAKGKEGAAC